MISWDTYVVKGSPSVILACISKLRTQVTSLNPGQVFESVEVSKRNHETVNTIGFTINHQLCKASSMGSKPTQVSWPEFGWCRSGWIDHELVGVLIESGSSLQSCHVRAMAQLSLTVVTKYLVSSDEVRPVLSLLFVGLGSDNECEHREVHTDGCETLEVVEPRVVRILWDIIVKPDIRPLLVE